MTGETGFKRVTKGMFDYEKTISAVHQYGFTGWKKSMRNRFFIEGFAALIATVLFQIYISNFNIELNIANKDLFELEGMFRSMDKN